MKLNFVANYSDVQDESVISEAPASKVTQAKKDVNPKNLNIKPKPEEAKKLDPKPIPTPDKGVAKKDITGGKQNTN
jgi:hypothetical protein